MLASILVAIAGQGTAAAPPDTLLLFVASWCAPCHAELREIDPIARAAVPLEVKVVAIDDRPATRRMLARVAAARVLPLAPPEALSKLRTLAGGAPGLPVSVATDGAGNPCAVSRRPLTPAAARVMRERCRP